MTQRNRIVLATVALAAALCVAAPAPSHAAGLRPWRTPVLLHFWEQAWNRLAGLLPGNAPARPAGRLEKEGGMINPDGGTTSGFTAPVPSGTYSDEGGAINPDGVK